MLKDYTSVPMNRYELNLLGDSLQGVLAFRRLRRFQIGLQFGETRRALVELHSAGHEFQNPGQRSFGADWRGASSFTSRRRILSGTPGARSGHGRGAGFGSE